MNRSAAIQYLKKNVKNPNLFRHCLAVEAVMGALYRRLTSKENKKEEEKWRIAGLLHDADYELTKDNLKKKHTKKTLTWLKEKPESSEIYDAVASHAWGYVVDAPKPKTLMQWSLYCCDELTGLIVAVALVKPDKKLASVNVDSVMKKWNSSSFAAGVNRKQIEECEIHLGIPLREFVEIALSAMQSIHEDLGL